MPRQAGGVIPCLRVSHGSVVVIAEDMWILYGRILAGAMVLRTSSLSRDWNRLGVVMAGGCLVWMAMTWNVMFVWISDG